MGCHMSWSLKALKDDFVCCLNHKVVLYYVLLESVETLNEQGCRQQLIKLNRIIFFPSWKDSASCCKTVKKTIWKTAAEKFCLTRLCPFWLPLVQGIKKLAWLVLATKPAQFFWDAIHNLSEKWKNFINGQYF